MVDIEPIEILWGELLSRQPEKIRAAFISITEEERQAVYVHLMRMSDEPDWHIEQQKSAQAALLVISHLPEAG